tara:strand:- start:560 stop:1612 length:1053 start_codon:yes stop_codon:yes gene_type:complete
MSKMLEQAIVDATALKEAALKNAEAEIVEKYAPEVKKVMESILEVEDDMSEETAGMEDPMAMKLPTAATDGENTCACPAEDDTVILDLDGLEDMVADTAPEAFTDEEDEEMPPAELALTPAIQEEDELPLEEDELAAVVAELLGEEEETLEEETVEEVKLEESPCDACDKPSCECNMMEEEAQPVIAEAKEEKKDTLQLEEIAGKTKELLKTITALQEQNDGFKSDNKKLVSETTEMKESIQTLTTTLEELSLQNAKLLYINEVLKNNSLNERQRQIAVEALQESKSVEQAKTVFDTLQSTVASSTKRHGRTESLSEAVSNNTSIRMPRKQQQQSNDPHSARWKRLAGIK